MSPRDHGAMPRPPRRIIPGLPYHITHRGNHREPLLATNDERQMYISIMTRWQVRTGVDVAAFVLMPNHVHFAASSPTPCALGAWIRNGHREYSKWYNTVRNRTGQNWEGRFFDVLMDPAHCLNALRYIEQNPVRAGLCEFPWQWKWSSAASHCGLGPSPSIVTTDFRPDRTTAKQWREALMAATPDEFRKQMMACARKGVPLAEEAWVKALETKLGIVLSAPKSGLPRGRPKKKPAPIQSELGGLVLPTSIVPGK